MEVKAMDWYMNIYATKYQYMIISMTLFSLHDYANIALTLIVKDKIANHLSIMTTMSSVYSGLS
jgi:hypothetical protein